MPDQNDELRMTQAEYDAKVNLAAHGIDPDFLNKEVVITDGLRVIDEIEDR